MFRHAWTVTAGPRDTFHWPGSFPADDLPVHSLSTHPRWIEAQKKDLLPVPYFHVVFTVPAELHALFLAAPKATYPLLFAAVAETLTQVALRRLGAQIAVTAILHTWTQLLLL